MFDKTLESSLHDFLLRIEFTKRGHYWTVTCGRSGSHAVMVPYRVYDEEDAKQEAVGLLSGLLRLEHGDNRPVPQHLTWVEVRTSNETDKTGGEFRPQNGDLSKETYELQ